MPEVVLATLNAKFIHAAFGLRYLRANLGPLRDRSVIREFDINTRPLDIAEALLEEDPRIIGLGVYIWNVTATTELVSLLKRIRPQVIIVLGGPEVSHETEGQPIVDLADYVVIGEGEVAFRTLCESLLSSQRRILTKTVQGGLPPLGELQLPYDEYTAADCAHRLIYVEASRGCPFKCEFCLSSLDEKVRQFPLPSFLAAMQQLFDRGVRHFKFVDRTFNLNIATSRAILQFFLDHMEPGLFVHFELIPDRLPDSLREVIAQFPPGSLQFEIGIQTLNTEVEALISRRQDHDKLAHNLRWLQTETGTHLHTDLIIGLPGEDLASFARGFDTLCSFGVQEIQVGILKRLRGTPISRHQEPFALVFSAHPPYEILSTSTIDFATMNALRRFARFWDIFANSGSFVQLMKLLLALQPSPFASFFAFSKWVFGKVGKTNAIGLARQCQLLWDYLVTDGGHDPAQIARLMMLDLDRTGRTEPFPFLEPYIDRAELRQRKRERLSQAPSRQSRHLDA